MKHGWDFNLSLGHIGNPLLCAKLLPVYHFLPMVTWTLAVSRLVVGADTTALIDLLLSHIA